MRLSSCSRDRECIPLLQPHHPIAIQSLLSRKPLTSLLQDIRTFSVSSDRAGIDVSVRSDSHGDHLLQSHLNSMGRENQIEEEEKSHECMASNGMQSYQDIAAPPDAAEDMVYLDPERNRTLFGSDVSEATVEGSPSHHPTSSPRTTTADSWVNDFTQLSPSSVLSDFTARKRKRCHGGEDPEDLSYPPIRIWSQPEILYLKSKRRRTGMNGGIPSSRATRNSVHDPGPNLDLVQKPFGLVDTHALFPRSASQVGSSPIPFPCGTQSDPASVHQPQGNRVRESKQRAVDHPGRRHTMSSVERVAQGTPHIDLRTVYQNRRRRGCSTSTSTSTYARITSHPSTITPSTSNSAHTRTSAKLWTPSTSPIVFSPTRPLPSPVAPEERDTIHYLGMCAALEDIAGRFGVQDEAAWRVWEALGSVAATEEYCRRYVGEGVGGGSEGELIGFSPKSGAAEGLGVTWSMSGQCIMRSNLMTEEPSSAGMEIDIKEEEEEEEEKIRKLRLMLETIHKEGNDTESAGSPRAVDREGDAFRVGKDEGAAFLSANSQNVAALQKLERLKDVDVLLRWTAARLVEFREAARARSPPHTPQLSLCELN